MYISNVYLIPILRLQNAKIVIHLESCRVVNNYREIVKFDAYNSIALFLYRAI